MSDFIGTIAMAEAITLSIAFCGTLLFAYGYFKRNLFGFIRMFIGGALVLFGIYSQYALLEMPYLLIALAIIGIPIVIMMPAASPSYFEDRIDRALIIAVIFYFVVGLVACLSFLLFETRALEKENSPYVTTEVKPPVTYFLKELHDGKYLIADGSYRYELLPNDDTEDLEQVVSPGEAIKILPLEDGNQPHLAITETWQHAHCPGIKSPYGDASYLIDRTVTIYVSLNQTAIAYSGT